MDIGLPMLSMHSIREIMGGNDLTHVYKILRRFLTDFDEIEKSVVNDAMFH